MMASANWRLLSHYAQLESQFIGGCCGKRDTIGEFFRRSHIYFVVLSHDNAEPPFAVHDDPIHLFVLRLGNKRNVDMNRLTRRFGFGTNSVDSA